MLGEGGVIGADVLFVIQQVQAFQDIDGQVGTAAAGQKANCFLAVAARAASVTGWLRRLKAG
jgi:hypothetical protein